ncbi:hypothetical protein [Clostridium beijerinckii]|uniref:hypothetical protein n=1 Tax=Clostridium beijerinckii TaxID=1520 RepID=UPI00156E2EE5|nr:hypothetical protein [Clostridium beijerinckii]NRU52412.1 ATP-dependent Lon protease [Clostridium beijerinckii]NYC69143.1 ATP-dependent Lon protease [Clostridium beijerinckii]NYC91903.1 ATP-dependent Lon protease [Clostridium beijerinckii]
MAIDNVKNKNKLITIIHNDPAILEKEDYKLLDEMINYIENQKINTLRKEIGTLMNEDIERTPKLSKLNEQLNCLEKSKKYDFNDKERYGKFYKRIMDKLKVNLEENKELLKVELIRLKEESKINNSIELTTEEIECLIEQLDILMKHEE